MDCKQISVCTACSEAKCFYVAQISRKCQCLKSLDSVHESIVGVVLPTKPCRRFAEENCWQEDPPDDQFDQSLIRNEAICAIIFGALGVVILTGLLYCYWRGIVLCWRNRQDGILELLEEARNGTARAAQSAWRWLLSCWGWVTGNWRSICDCVAARVGRRFRVDLVDLQPHDNDLAHPLPLPVEALEQIPADENVDGGVAVPGGDEQAEARRAAITNWLLFLPAWVMGTWRTLRAWAVTRAGRGNRVNLIDLELGEIDPAHPLEVPPQPFPQNPVGDNGGGGVAFRLRVEENGANEQNGGERVEVGGFDGDADQACEVFGRDVDWELLRRIREAGQDVGAILADIRLVMERARVHQDEEEGQRRNDDRRDEEERQQWEREREVRRREMEEIEKRRQEERQNRERVLRDWAVRFQAAAERQRQELAVVRPAEDEEREEEAQGNDMPGVEEGEDEAAEQVGRAHRLPTHGYNLRPRK
ncbi:unnamed protein product [Allacma fusca]|uniref:Uncharacterized protein n=1 Tax=Allacma fusca TaxID=39272 RepID=A0A8J2KFV7_9HEXA|nr:unnamed protein product [Allacma fusca]